MFLMLVQLEVPCMLWFPLGQRFHKQLVSLVLSRHIGHLGKMHWQAMK